MANDIVQFSTAIAVAAMMGVITVLCVAVAVGIWKIVVREKKL